MIFSIFVILSLSSRTCNSASILFLSEVPSPSHHLWLRTVAVELANKGHNITFVSCDADEPQLNLHFIHMEKVYENLYASDGSVMSFLDTGSKNIFLQYLDTPPLVLDVCGGLLQSKGWQQLNNYPNDFKFDLMIHDYMVGVCLLTFSEKFNNPSLVSMTAFRDNEHFHVTTKTAIIPSRNTLPYFYRQAPITFLERIANFLMHMFDKIIWFYYLYPKSMKMVQETNSFDYLPSIDNILRTKVFLTNYDPAVDEVQQLPPNVIGVGGLQIKPPSMLPENLQEIADNAVNGLIVFSLGTNIHIQELGESIVTNILDAFKNYPEYTFIWKVDVENINTVRTPSNVVISKWIPQNDLLAHRNTKLFITHGGIMSTQEAIWYGIPMLGIPIFFDQYSNVHKSVDRGIAEVVYIKDLTMENLSDKIFLLMSNPKYKENIQEFSNAFRDRMETPLQRAVWWIEWTIRNPNTKVFEGTGQSLNFLQIESVDVIAFLTVFLGIVLYLLVWLNRKCFYYLYSCYKKMFNSKLKKN